MSKDNRRRRVKRRGDGFEGFVRRAQAQAHAHFRHDRRALVWGLTAKGASVFLYGPSTFEDLSRLFPQMVEEGMRRGVVRWASAHEDGNIIHLTVVDDIQSRRYESHKGGPWQLVETERGRCAVCQTVEGDDDRPWASSSLCLQCVGVALPPASGLAFWGRVVGIALRDGAFRETLEGLDEEECKATLEAAEWLTGFTRRADLH